MHAEWQLDGLTATKYCAFTVAELGERLPGGFVGYKKIKGDDAVGCANFRAHSGTVGGNTEAKARAKALRSLLDNTLVIL